MHALKAAGAPTPGAASADGLPIPDARRILAVNGNTDVEGFLETGARAAATVRDVLARNAVDVASLGAILDFGCGCGRVTRHWRSLSPATAVHGTDFNPDLIAWCRDHLAFAAFAINGLEPPLQYEPASFDLIYAFSVFTHFPEELQRPWLDELLRVLRPGGHVLFSTHGDFYVPSLVESEKRRYAEGGLVVRHDIAAGTNLCAAFHPPDYVRQRLLAGVTLVDYAPEGALGNPRQDVYLIRKPLT
jgi:SAM-dependent methyltransferase